MAEEIRDGQALLSIAKLKELWAILQMNEQRVSVPSETIGWLRQCEASERWHVVPHPLRRARTHWLPANVSDVFDLQRLAISRSQQFIVFGAFGIAQVLHEVLGLRDARKGCFY
jgi:hypothetical protein